MEEPKLETQVRDVDGFPIIDVSGEIDLYTAPAFKKALSQTIENGHIDIVVNMSHVSYMDSSGFGTLLGVTKRVRPDGGTVSLIGCNDAINRMLKITRLNTVFGIFDREEDALRQIRTARAM